MRTPRAAALLILVVALAVRLVHVWQLRRAPFFALLMGDSRAYDEWAQRIAAGEWIGRDVFYQAPLYPYFLGLVYSLAGRDLLIVRVVQAVIGSASCVLLAGAARRLFQRDSVGLAAGLLLALYAPAIFFDGLIQKSVLDVFFICVALWLISRTYNAEDAKDAKRSSFLRPLRPLRFPSSLWFALGLTMGALALTRENAGVLIVVILAWILVAGQRRTTKDQRPKRAVAFLTGLALVLVPVAARNSYLGGGFYVTTSQFGPNFYIGNNPHADGTYASLRYGRGAPEYERQDATELAERALGRRLTPAEVSSYWTDRSLDFITSQPRAWLALMGRKFVLLWNRAEMVDTEDAATHAEWSWPLRMSGPVTHFGVLVPLALAGMIVAWRDRRRVLIVYALLAAYAASVLVFYVFARYRYPLVPFLILFAAVGVVALVRGADLRRSGLRTTIVAALVSAVFTNWRIIPPNWARAVTENNIGVALQAEGRYDDSVEHYRRSIAWRPDYAPALNNMATALRAAGRLDEALAAYARALALRADYPEAHYNLANALTEAGRPREAVAHFQRALESMPASADVHNNLGIALAGEGKLDEASAEFREAIAIEPSSPQAHRNLGDALLSRGAVEDGLRHLRRAVELAPADGSLRYDLGSALLESGRTGDAIKELGEAVRLSPASAEAHNNLGIALGSAGRLDEAIDQFREALKLDPGSKDARRNLDLATQERNRGARKDRRD